eukprot:TRINITY_DN1336_c0_g2_i1.p1 TRINITY_DN1336_c0_g2~~TRINITY_DN1336_c0_g2_i1.p1  ORF type:complete len:364 (+),score=134.70 TRINITY_DN1336_c0_g2_i1:61-1152(+)
MARPPLTRVDALLTYGDQLVDVAALWAEEGMPMLDPPATTNTQRVAAAVDAFVGALPEGQELGFSTVFSPYVVDACCVRGVFPMSIALETADPDWNLDLRFFAPRLHHERHVIDLASFRPLRHAARRASQYTVTLNTDIDAVLDAIVRHHTLNWMCPLLQAQLKYMHAHPKDFRTQIVTVEVWREAAAGARELAACEVGYAVGGVYTSMTGARDVSGAGSVQLAVLGALLKDCGFAVWDLGCTMDYKAGLGAVVCGREGWLQLMRQQHNAAQAALVLPGGAKECACTDVVDTAAAPAPPAPAAAGRAAKLARKAAKRAAAAAWRSLHDSNDTLDPSAASDYSSACEAATAADDDEDLTEELDA